MKYQYAYELGNECGLEDPYEYIENVIIHSTSLFVWSEIRKEIKELLLDARDNYQIDISDFEDELQDPDEVTTDGT